MIFDDIFYIVKFDWLYNMKKINFIWGLSSWLKNPGMEPIGIRVAPDTELAGYPANLFCRISGQSVLPDIRCNPKIYWPNFLDAVKISFSMFCATSLRSAVTAGSADKRKLRLLDLNLSVSYIRNRISNPSYIYVVRYLPVHYLDRY